MILKELYELYDRLLKAGKDVPPPGFYFMSLSFRIVLSPAGDLIRIEDAREAVSVRKGKTSKTEMRTASALMPGRAKPPGQGINPCFLGDNAAYLLGLGKADATAKDAARARECFETLRGKHLQAEHMVNSPAYSAVCRFLERWNPAEPAGLEGEDADMLKANGVFRIQGALHDVHEEPAVAEWWKRSGEELWWGGVSGKAAPSGICLITNDPSPIAITHEPAIQGVLGAQSSGAKMVSFNCKSFESYGKEQSANAPVSPTAAFAYSNALNYLLSSRQHRTRIGETSVVFWTDAPEQSEEVNLLVQYSLDSFPAFDGEEEEGQELRERVRKSLSELAQGLPLSNCEALRMAKNRFFILGLSPNAARLAVRFYRESDLGDFLDHLRDHLAGLRLQPRGVKFNDPEVISPYLILSSCVRESKDIPPQYGGALMRAILFGDPYPDTVAMAILRRFKADGDINYIRCAYLKAWLNRLHPTHPITTMLDPTNTDPAYLLGRLFAVLNKTQEDAQPGINRTIRETYYSSASATPGSVFPRLLRLYTHHIAKLEGGRKIVRERLSQEIMSLLGSTFPARLDLRGQGAFALGFYQQTQAFYTKNATPDAAESPGS